MTPVDSLSYTSNTFLSSTVHCSRVASERHPLVDRFFSAHKYKVKTGKQDWVYIAQSAGETLGALRLIPQPQGSLLMRNLYVAPEARGQRIASRLVDFVSVSVAPASVYCYALPHLQPFYLSRGYQHFTPEQVPSDIADLYLRYKFRNRDWVLMGFVQP